MKRPQHFLNYGIVFVLFFAGAVKYRYLTRTILILTDINFSVSRTFLIGLLF